MFVVSFINVAIHTPFLTFVHCLSLCLLLSVSQLSLEFTLLSTEKEMLNEIDYDNLINDSASQKA